MISNIPSSINILQMYFVEDRKPQMSIWFKVWLVLQSDLLSMTYSESNIYLRNSQL